jgi:hypothetical protein
MSRNANAPIGVRGAAGASKKLNRNNSAYTVSRSKNQAQRKFDPVYQRNRFARLLVQKEFEEARRRHKWGGR